MRSVFMQRPSVKLDAMRQKALPAAIEIALAAWTDHGPNAQEPMKVDSSERRPRARLLYFRVVPVPRRRGGRLPAVLALVQTVSARPEAVKLRSISTGRAASPGLADGPVTVSELQRAVDSTQGWRGDAAQENCRA